MSANGKSTDSSDDGVSVGVAAGTSPRSPTPTPSQGRPYLLQRQSPSRSTGETDLTTGSTAPSPHPPPHTPTPTGPSPQPSLRPHPQNPGVPPAYPSRPVREPVAPSLKHRVLLGQPPAAPPTAPPFPVSPEAGSGRGSGNAVRVGSEELLGGVGSGLDQGQKRKGHPDGDDLLDELEAIGYAAEVSTEARNHFNREDDRRAEKKLRADHQMGNDQSSTEQRVKEDEVEGVDSGDEDASTPRNNPGQSSNEDIAGDVLMRDQDGGEGHEEEDDRHIAG